MTRSTLICVALIGVSAGCAGDDGSGEGGTLQTSGTPTTAPSTTESTSGELTSGSPTSAETSNGPTAGTDPTNGDTTTMATTIADDTTGASTETGGEVSATLYLNFDGVTLGGGDADDATSDTTAIVDLEGTWAPADATRAPMILAGVRSVFAPFAIEVTDTRPVSGDYTMVVVTQAPSPIMNAAGLGLVDCDDANPANVVAVFDSNMDFPADVVVDIVGFQVGLSYGLNAVEGADGDVMTPVIGTGGRTFTDACADEAATASCIAATASCDAGQQNSFQELLGRFGAG